MSSARHAARVKVDPRLTVQGMVRVRSCLRANATNVTIYSHEVIAHNHEARIQSRRKSTQSGSKNTITRQVHEDEARAQVMKQEHIVTKQAHSHKARALPVMKHVLYQS